VLARYTGIYFELTCKYTFLVLRRIIDTECSLLLTDHERLIICFTGSPYPVWIWTADGSTREEYEFAYRIVMEKGLLNREHKFNVKYELAEYFIKRAAEDNQKLAITMISGSNGTLFVSNK
jgi:hypothetical protein